MQDNQEVGVTTAAAIKGLKLSALLYLLKLGRGPTFRIVDGRKLFLISEIKAWTPQWQGRGRKKK